MPLKQSKNNKSNKKQNGGSYKNPSNKNPSNKNPSKKSKKQNGGKLNAYFKLMLDAKKNDLPSFTYNGNTYKQFTAKTGLKMYKKA